MAARTHADLVGVHVHTSDGLDEGRQDLLDRHRALLEQLGGRYAEVTGTDIADALVRFARAENATQLVLGASKRSRWAELTRGSVINRAIKQSGPIDVHVISTDSTTRAPHEGSRTRREPSAPRSARARSIAWALALVGVPLFAIALLPFKDAIGVPGTLLLLLLPPVAIAMLGGLRPALVGSAIAFVCADWFYIEPTHSLRFAHAGDALALVVFVAVSALVSGLVDRLARRTAQLAKSQAETEALAELASGTALLDDDSLHRLVIELRVALALESVAVLAPTPEGWRVEASSGEPVPTSPEGASYSAELASGSVLVVKGPSLPAEDRRLLSAFVAHLRLAQDTLRLQAAALEASTLAEGNRVREALLAAVSHDLRGPLANIKAAASSLLSEDVEWPPEEVRSFCTTIDAEADRLHAVVSNLLDMGRLQAGMIGVHLQPTVVEEVDLRGPRQPVGRRVHRRGRRAGRPPLGSRRPHPPRTGGRERHLERARLGARGVDRAGRGRRRRWERRHSHHRSWSRHPPRPTRRGVPPVSTARRRWPPALRRHRPRARRDEGLRRGDGRRSPHRRHAGRRDYGHDHA